MWVYRNPVTIVFGAGSLAELPRLLAGRRHALVTYPDAVFEDLRERLAGLGTAPVVVIDDVAPNPDTRLLALQASRFARATPAPEVIVALGGGSVIDTAKVLAAAGGDFAAVARYLETGQGGAALHPTPIIAVPTTAGTGSEVTSWSTVWDAAGGKKHSLALPGLYPEVALIDPELMLAKPRGLTIATGLDALSHALESLWNKNANPVSMTFAVSAARDILAVLPALADDLGNLELRSRMARAALSAGLAFSNTKTAIAHSISYPITLRHGVPHGIACSFTLPRIMRSVAGVGGICGEGLAAIFRCSTDAAAARLDGFLGQLDIATAPGAYGIASAEWQGIVEAALDGERGLNFIGSRGALEAVMAEGVAPDARLSAE